MGLTPHITQGETARVAESVFIAAEPGAITVYRIKTKGNLWPRRKEPNMRQLCKGNVAVVKGAILAGCRAYYGYPITPASEIAESAALYFRRLAELSASGE